MTTDTPVSADDLAAALRSVLDQIASGLDEFAEDDMEQAEAILDRFDAQRQKAEVDRITAYIEADDWATRTMMESARVARDKGDIASCSTCVTKARLSNHHSIRHRRQLRALGGEA